MALSQVHLAANQVTPPAGGSAPALDLGGGSTPMQLPHDIRELLPYAPPWWVYLATVLLLLGVVAILVWAWRVWRQRRRRGRQDTPVDPWQQMLSALAAMPAEVPAVGEWPARAREDFFYRLSLLLRQGIEWHAAIPATDLTLGELKQPLRQRLVVQAVPVDAVLAFLERADQVKFAAAPATIEEALAAVRQVRNWIEALRPVPGGVGDAEGWHAPSQA